MNYVELVLTIGCINGLIIGFILFSLNNANRLATSILGAIVILFSLIIGEELAEFMQWVLLYPKLLNIADSFTLLIGPLLFIYAQLITERKKKLIVTDFFHGLPFLFFMVYLLPFYILMNDEKSVYTSYDPSGLINSIKATIVVVYILYTLMYIVRFENSQKKPGFPANNYQNIKWFKGLLIAFIALGFLLLLMTIMFNQDVSLPFDPDTFSVLALSLLFYAVSIKLMRNPFLFWSIAEMDRATQQHFQETESLEPERYKNSPLTRNDLEQYMAQLSHVMQKDQPYLNSELTPNELEEATGIKAYYISQTLSEVLNKNFYEFVNAYRIEEVKKMILDRSQDYKTLLALALESGFNSKSSFNRVFKQYTGMTPTQFKKKNRN